MKIAIARAACLFLLLAACRSEAAPAGGGGAAPVETVQIATAAPTTTRPAVTVGVPLPLVFNPAPAEQEPVNLPASPAAPSPLPTVGSEPRLCSPLVDTPIQDLLQIVSDPYHPPPPGREERHHGVDFAYYNRFGRASVEEAGIQGILAGYVAASLHERFPYGNAIIIQTPASLLPLGLAARLQMAPEQSLYILFAHMHAAPLAALNDRVEACQLLGSAGRSGNAGSAHLHMEARIGPAGKRFESMAYYSADVTQAERDAYLLWRISGEFRHFDPMLLFTAPEP